MLLDSLPRELRDEIYRHVLGQTRDLYYGRRQLYHTNRPLFKLYTTATAADEYGLAEGIMSDRPPTDQTLTKHDGFGSMVKRAMSTDGDQLRYVNSQLYKEASPLVTNRLTRVHFYPPEGEWLRNLFWDQIIVDFFNHHYRYFPPRQYVFNFYFNKDVGNEWKLPSSLMRKGYEATTLLHPILHFCHDDLKVKVNLCLAAVTIFGFAELAVQLIMAFRGLDLTHLLFWKKQDWAKWRWDTIEHFRGEESLDWMNVPNLRFWPRTKFDTVVFRGKIGASEEASELLRYLEKWHKEGF